MDKYGYTVNRTQQAELIARMDGVTSDYDLSDPPDNFFGFKTKLDIKKHLQKTIDPNTLHRIIEKLEKDY